MTIEQLEKIRGALRLGLSNLPDRDYGTTWDDDFRESAVEALAILDAEKPEPRKVVPEEMIIRLAKIYTGNIYARMPGIVAIFNDYGYTVED